MPGVGHAPTLMDLAQIAPVRDFLLAGEGGYGAARLAAFSLPDWIALGWFLVCWIGYGWMVGAQGRWAAPGVCSGETTIPP